MPRTVREVHIVWRVVTLNYGSSSNNEKLVHWPLMGGLLAYMYIWYSEEETE